MSAMDGQHCMSDYSISRYLVWIVDKKDYVTLLYKSC